MSDLPGSIWNNAGRWNWRVKLPGSEMRKNYPLRAPGQKVAISVNRKKHIAEAVAWRMWEKAEGAARGEVAEKKEVESFNDVVGEFMAWANDYYRHVDGSPTQEVYRCSRALRILRERHGSKPVDDIGYMEILDARDALTKLVARTTVNAYAGIWKRFFGWALEHRRCSPAIKTEIWALSPLKKNRSGAKEKEPVKPVEHWRVKQAVVFMPNVLAKMVQVQELCGARPGEMCMMKPCEIDRRRKVWIYRPPEHKNRHKDLPRVICLGPRAQKLLTPLLDNRDEAAYVFQPAEAQAQRLKDLRANRKSKVQPSQLDRKKNDQKYKPGQAYVSGTYARAVLYACRRAGVEHFTPNQLRHSCGTRCRKKFGPDSARAVLGHSAARGAKITDRYTFTAIEKEFILAASRVMRVIG